MHRRDFICTLGAVSALLPLATREALADAAGDAALVIQEIEVLRLMGTQQVLRGVNHQPQSNPANLYPERRPPAYKDAPGAKPEPAPLTQYYVRIRTRGGLDHEAVPGAEHRPQPAVDVHQPQARPGAPSRQHVLSMLRQHARPVVLHGDHAVLALGLAADLHRSAALGPLDAVLHGVLHQRLQREERDRDREHLRRDAHLHPQPLAQDRAGERQIGLDGAELARQRRVLAVPGEVVPDVEGEVEQQLTGAGGIGTHDDAIVVSAL